MKIEEPKLSYQGTIPCQEFVSYSPNCDLCGMPTEAHGDLYGVGTFYVASVMSRSRKSPIGITIGSPAIGIKGLAKAGSALALAEVVAGLLNQHTKDNQ